MRKNKKGFTLIELIVCLTLVAALTLAATLGLQKVLKANKVSTYKNDLKDIGASARQYLVSQKLNGTSSMNSINLSNVVSSGLISSDYYEKTNGLNCSQFSSSTKIYYQTVDGLLKVYMDNKDGQKCDLENIDNDTNCTIKEDC